MKAGEVIERLEVTGISSEGKSVGRHQGQVIFVDQAIPGDVVDVKVTRKRRKHLEGYPVLFHQKSSERQEPFCRHFGLCGGCKWQHMKYEAQLAFKQEHVWQNLSKLSKCDLPPINPIIGSEEIMHYRNKLEFTFSNARWLTEEEIATADQFSRDGLGFHIPKRFDKVLDLEECWLQPEPSNDIRMAVRDYAKAHGLSFYDVRAHSGYLRNLIIRTNARGEVMVILQVAQDQPEQLFPLLDFIKERFPEVISLHYVINSKLNETFHDLLVINYSGQPFLLEEMEGLKFRVGPKSFFQTNSKQAYRLYRIVRDLAGLHGKETVYDLYTGTGTIANFLAPLAGKVVGVESVEASIQDARENSILNQIENCVFEVGDMKNVLNTGFVERHGKPQVIVTDPPRAGMHEEVVQAINAIAPDRVVYVSCNPATQARDLELMKDHFEVETIQPVDMFPQTHHVENVLLLKARINGK